MIDRERNVDEILADYKRQEENRKAGEAFEILFSCPYTKTCPKALWYMYSRDGMVIRNCIRFMDKFKMEDCPKSEKAKKGL